MKTGTIHDPATLIGHTETLTYLVHRCDEDDHWALLDEDDSHQAEGIWEFMHNRIIDMGGVLLRVEANAVVTFAKVVVDGSDE